MLRSPPVRSASCPVPAFSSCPPPSIKVPGFTLLRVVPNEDRSMMREALPPTPGWRRRSRCFGPPLRAFMARSTADDDASTSSKSELAIVTPTVAFVLLNLVTILWGTQHAVIKSTLSAVPDTAGLINLLRFGLASLLFLPWTPNAFKEENKGIWKAGAELGLWMFAGYALQAVGLEFTTASRSGFLLYLNVKLVPLFAFLILGRKISIDVWLYALMAFTGTALLSFDGSPPNIGDLWSILAAAASAMFILRLEGAAAAYSARQSKELNSATLWVTTGLCGLWALLDLVKGGGVHPEVLQEVISEDWSQILYLGVVTTAICNWIQTIGQREVPAEKAALIYAMDPVYGAIFARLLLGDSEILGVQGILGAGLVTASAVASTLFSKKQAAQLAPEGEGHEMVAMLETKEGMEDEQT